MRVLCSDFECTTSNHGNPFDLTNTAVGLATKSELYPACFSTEILETIRQLRKEINTATLFVFFNAKFDLHWYRNCGFHVTNPIWCCQLAEFYLNGQRYPYPSLNDTSQSYGLGQKLDVIKLEYWDKGINTDKIPLDVLGPYACQDVDLTYKIYLKQLERFKQNPKLYALFKIACEDLKILEEMEWNGLKYDKTLCVQRAGEIKEKLKAVDEQLNSVYPELSINFGSGDQLSAFLYGGLVHREVRECIGFYKTGVKLGEPRFKVTEITHELPRLIEPLPRSELLKEGVFATDEGTLRKLKGSAAKKYVPLLLERARLEKLLGTYYEGIPKLAQKMNWKDEYIHGQFNQVVAATGRLSSTKPNLQNFAGDIEDVFITRYEN